MIKRDKSRAAARIWASERKGFASALSFVGRAFRRDLRFFTVPSPRSSRQQREAGTQLCDAIYTHTQLGFALRDDENSRSPYRVTSAPQTHNVTRLWCRKVHKCSQVQQRVCMRYVCILDAVYVVYRFVAHTCHHIGVQRGIRLDGSVFSQFSWRAPGWKLRA